MTAAMDQAKAVADAVLYEGYLLYPYRASATKNKVRWQWGVLMPPAYAASGTGEHSGSRTELLADPRDDATLHVRVRFLQLQQRIVEDTNGHPVPSLTIGGTEYTTWEEAVEREIDAILPLASLLDDHRTIPFTVDGGSDIEPLPDGARLIRRRAPLRGDLRLHADPIVGPYGGMKLRLQVENTSPWHHPNANRNDALHHALIAAHSLLWISTGSFLSLLDPPEWARVATEECVNERAWPVLVGNPNTVLCSPIILYDYPTIAEESAGNLFDGTEIDEILTLRTMTLTDNEKREARATDPRAAEIIDRVDHLPPELLDRLHGTVRYLKSLTTSNPHPQPTPQSTTHPKPPTPDPSTGKMDVGSPPGTGGGYPNSGVGEQRGDSGAAANYEGSRVADQDSDVADEERAGFPRPARRVRDSGAADREDREAADEAFPPRTRRLRNPGVANREDLEATDEEREGFPGPARRLRDPEAADREDLEAAGEERAGFPQLARRLRNPGAADREDLEAADEPGGFPRPKRPWWDPGADALMSPETDRVMIAGVSVGKGTRVTLRPNRRADAHDMFMDGRTAVVQAVLLDVDGDWHLAVTLEDDLGSDLFAAHGRYRYFATDEVEPL